MDDVEHRTISLNEKYLISETGKVFSLHSNRYLKLSMTGCYYSIKINTPEKRRGFHVHRLVAEHFIPNDDPINFNVVNHKDGNKTNNHKDNLEWTNISGNTKHCIDKIISKRTGLTRRVHQLDPKTEDIIDTFSSMKEAAQKLGIKNPSDISGVCRGCRKMSGGYKWIYADEPLDVSDDKIWRPIPNFEKYYASVNGEIFSTKKNKLIRQHIDSSGYLSTAISNKEIRRTLRVHRLMAITFIPNPSNHPIVDHIDGNKHNNKLDNLRWCSLADNSNFVIENGGGITRPVIQYDMKLNLIAKYNSAAEAQRKTGIRSNCIIDVCRGNRSKTAGGFIWRYVENPIIDTSYSIKNNKGTSKAVAQIDDRGNAIAKYVSQTEASKCTGLSRSSIGMTCQGKLEHVRGTYWRFLEEGESLEIIEPMIKKTSK